MSLVPDDGVVAGFLLSLLVVGPTVLALAVGARRRGEEGGGDAGDRRTGSEGGEPVGSRRLDPAPFGGVVALCASFLALAVVEGHSWALLAGTVLAGVGGYVGAALRLPAVLRIALVAPGAVVAVVSVPSSGAWWFVPASIAAAAVTGPAADGVDAHYGRTGLALVMLCVSAGGIYGTIPNTDLVGPMFGAFIPVLVLAWPRPWARVGPGAASATLALFAAMVVGGGWTRPGAIVGGVLAPAMFVLLVASGRPDDARVDRAWTPLAVRLVALDLALTLGLTRIAGLEESAWAATALAAPMLAGAWWVTRRFVAGHRLAIWQAAIGLTAVAVIASLLVVRLVTEEPGPDTSRSCPERPFVDAAELPQRAEASPVHAYPLDEGSGTLIADAAGALDLAIGEPRAVGWGGGGGLVFATDGAMVRSARPAGDLAAAVAASGEVTVEAWFAPSELPQDGPARVLTVSGGPEPDEVNVHLGVEDRGVSFRVRTDCDLFNWTRTAEVLGEDVMHHVVASYRPGEVTIWVDGALVTSDRTPVGLPDDWDPTLHLYLGDEATADRPFLGTVRQAALYDRALTEPEVAAHFQAGAGS